MFSAAGGKAESVLASHLDLLQGSNNAIQDVIIPPARFAHTATPINPAAQKAAAMVVFGGVNPEKDLNDVAVWHFQAQEVLAT